MLPGFLIPIQHTTTAQGQGVQLAGPWDKPKPGCEGVSTSTLCVVPVLWCTDHYRCYDPTKGYYSKSYGPYPCGGCVSTQGW